MLNIKLIKIIIFKYFVLKNLLIKFRFYHNYHDYYKKKNSGLYFVSFLPNLYIFI